MNYNEKNTLCLDYSRFIEKHVSSAKNRFKHESNLNEEESKYIDNEVDIEIVMNNKRVAYVVSRFNIETFEITDSDLFSNHEDAFNYSTSPSFAESDIVKIRKLSYFI